jgi:hypothetical protein
MTVPGPWITIASVSTGCPAYTQRLIRLRHFQVVEEQVDISGAKCWPIWISVAAKDRRGLSSFINGAILLG